MIAELVLMVSMRPFQGQGESSNLLFCTIINTLNNIIMSILEEKVKTNEEFINKYTIDEWVTILKHICIACINIPSNNEIDAIMKANSYKVTYEEGKISNIILYTTKLAWEDFKVELNSLYIIVSRQKGHSEFEQITFIPINIFKLF